MESTLNWSGNMLRFALFFVLATVAFTAGGAQAQFTLKTYMDGTQTMVYPKWRINGIEAKLDIAKAQLDVAANDVTVDEVKLTIYKKGPNPNQWISAINAAVDVTGPTGSVYDIAATDGTVPPVAFIKGEDVKFVFEVKIKNDKDVVVTSIYDFVLKAENTAAQ